MLTVGTFLFLLVGSISLENSCRKYTSPTSSCPKNKSEWDKRTTEFRCSTPGTAYTCMILRDSIGIESDNLVDTCINTAYEIADGFTGCPIIIACDKDGPLIGTEYTLMPCHETVPGCPPKYHGGYTVTELYKYQACLLLNDTDMRPSSSGVLNSSSTEDPMRSSTQSKLTTAHIPNSTTRLPGLNDAQEEDAAENRPIEIIVPVTLALVLTFSVIFLFFLCRRYSWNRRMHICSLCVYYSSNNVDKEIPLINRRREYRDKGIQQLHKKLQEINNTETERVILSPLHHIISEPLEMIYAPVSIRKDLEEVLRKQCIDEEIRPKPQPVNGPRDIFMKNGKPTRYVMMQGEAGRGKSVYCLKLVKDWCKAKQHTTNRRYMSYWVKYMDTFDFLFLVQLRHVMESRVALLDMICDDLEAKGAVGYRETVCDILRDEKYKCLIIVDGLDEWKVPEELVSSSFSGIPDLKGFSHSTFFFTMRPWKFDAVVDLIVMYDRVIEIQGLDEVGIKILMKKLLINHFELKENTSRYKQRFQEIQNKAENVKVKALLQIPLVAVVSILLWNEDETVGNCLTTFYIAIIRMLVERAIKNKAIDRKILDESRNASLENLNIPDLLRNDKTLYKVCHVLYKLGKVAFEGMTQRHSRLVFDETEIKGQIGNMELEFALRTGILSKSEKFVSVSTGPSCSYVSFFHKTVQELLTAIYVSSTKEASDFFLEHLSKIEVIMEFENVNMFVSGLSPSLGETLSQQIVKVANTDPDICLYREIFHPKLQNKVELLYKMQLGCLRELQQSLKDISHSAQEHDFQISDVYVNDNSDTDTVRMTADVLRNHNTNIISLFTRRVLNATENGIDDDVINNFLEQTTTLTSFLIDGSYSDRTLHTINTVSSLKSLVLFNLSITPTLLHDIQTALHNNTHIHTFGLKFLKCVGGGEEGNDHADSMSTSFCGLLQNLPSCEHLSELNISYLKNKEERSIFVNILPQLLHLKVIWYFGSTFYDEDDAEYDFTIARTVSQRTQVQVLVLGYISLGERSLELTADMDQMEEVWLVRVKMSAGSWSKFIASLGSIQCKFDVRLYDTEISGNCLSEVCSSPNFTVTYMYTNEGQSWLFFIREYLPTSQTQEQNDDDVSDSSQSD